MQKTTTQLYRDNGHLPLEAHHVEELRASSINDDLIEARGYRSVTSPGQLPDDFKGVQRKLTGLLIPVRGVVDGKVETYQLKPDNPRVDDTGRVRKYERPAGSRNVLDVPPSVLPTLSDASQPLWITEGSKKVDSASSNGLNVTIGLLGVWNWMSDAFPIRDWHKVTLQDREVVIAFDSDVMRKDSVREALDKLSKYLQSQGASVRFCLMPDLENGVKCGLDDWFAAGNTAEDLERHIYSELPPPEPEWDPPSPLLATSSTPFPTDALPDVLSKYVEAVANSTQTPHDLVAAMILGTISGATRGTVEVQGPTWTEPMVLQLLAIAEPGSRKSAVVNTVIAPVAEWERNRRKQDAAELAQWESTRRILEDRLKKLEHSGEIETPEHTNAVSELLNFRAQMPIITRILIDDSTPESAVSTMAEQGGAAAVISAEGTFFSNLAGRYADSPRLDVMLKGHAGDPITVSRQSRSAEEIERATLTISAAVQPDVLHELGKTSGFVARGAAARLLPSFIPDTRAMDDLDAPRLGDHFTLGWKTLVHSLLEASTGRLHDEESPRLSLELDQEAIERFNDVRAQCNGLMGESGILRNMPDWGSKLAGAVLRLAGTLHMAQHFASEGSTKISGNTMENAARLAWYFMDHALVMHRFLAGNSAERLAADVLKAAWEIGRTFSKRDLHRKLSGRIAFETSDTLNQPLQVLERKGWIRKIMPTPKQPGRRSERYEFNPLVTEGDIDKTHGFRGSVDIVGVNENGRVTPQRQSPNFHGYVSPQYAQTQMSQ